MAVRGRRAPSGPVPSPHRLVVEITTDHAAVVDLAGDFPPSTLLRHAGGRVVTGAAFTDTGVTIPVEAGRHRLAVAPPGG